MITKFENRCVLKCYVNIKVFKYSNHANNLIAMSTVTGIMIFAQSVLRKNYISKTRTQLKSQPMVQSWQL